MPVVARLNLHTPRARLQLNLPRQLHNVVNSMAPLPLPRTPWACRCPARQWPGAVQPVGSHRRATGENDMRVIDDTYNATPPRCRADTAELFRASPRSVLGDVAVGDWAEQGHRDVGEYARGVSRAYAVGQICPRRQRNTGEQGASLGTSLS